MITGFKTHFKESPSSKIQVYQYVSQEIYLGLNELGKFDRESHVNPSKFGKRESHFFVKLKQKGDLISK